MLSESSSSQVDKNVPMSFDRNSLLTNNQQTLTHAVNTPLNHPPTRPQAPLPTDSVSSASTSDARPRSGALQRREPSFLGDNEKREKRYSDVQARSSQTGWFSTAQRRRARHSDNAFLCRQPTRPQTPPPHSTTATNKDNEEQQTTNTFSTLNN